MFIKHNNFINTKNDAGTGNLSSQIRAELRGLSVIQDGTGDGHAHRVRATCGRHQDHMTAPSTPGPTPVRRYLFCLVFVQAFLSLQPLPFSAFPTVWGVWLLFSASGSLLLFLRNNCYCKAEYKYKAGKKKLSPSDVKQMIMAKKRFGRYKL